MVRKSRVMEPNGRITSYPTSPYTHPLFCTVFSLCTRTLISDTPRRSISAVHAGSVNPGRRRAR
jgi:hypothetical protein